MAIQGAAAADALALGVRYSVCGGCFFPPLAILPVGVCGSGLPSTHVSGRVIVPHGSLILHINMHFMLDGGHNTCIVFGVRSSRKRYPVGVITFPLASLLQLYPHTLLPLPPLPCVVNFAKFSTHR